MRAAFSARGLVPVAVVAGVVAVACGAGPSLGASSPLPPGCNLEYGGQTIGAFGGHLTTFRFEGYNAVPPGHRATGTRITWGDGKTTAAKARTRSTPFLKGCYVTYFTGRHTYPAPPACSATPCSKTYRVKIRYRDASTNARHTMNKLRVVVARRSKT